MSYGCKHIYSLLLIPHYANHRLAQSALTFFLSFEKTLYPISCFSWKTCSSAIFSSASQSLCWDRILFLNYHMLTCGALWQFFILVCLLLYENFIHGYLEKKSIFRMVLCSEYACAKLQNWY